MHGIFRQVVIFIIYVQKDNFAKRLEDYYGET